MPPPGPRRSTLRPLWIVLAIGAVVVVVLVALATIPVAHAYSVSLVSSGGAPSSQDEVFPSGATVSGHWSSAGGVKVTFEVTGLVATPYSQFGTSGSFSFKSTFALYEFEANGSASFNVTVSGTYAAPLI